MVSKNNNDNNNDKKKRIKVLNCKKKPMNGEHKKRNFTVPLIVGALILAHILVFLGMWHNIEELYEGIQRQLWWWPVE